MMSHNHKIFDRFPWTLQHYEKVVLSLLRDDESLSEEKKRSFPEYARESEEEEERKTKREEIWKKVPEACHPAVPPKRLKRKRWQLESMIGLAISVVSEGNEKRPRRVLDLCGGTGQIGVVIASLLPDCEVVICDINEESIDIAETRIREAGLRNVSTMCCDVRDLIEKKLDFTLGIALHACGGLSDLCMKLCCESNAAFVVCPCCVGKLKEGTYTHKHTKSKFFQTRLDVKSYGALIRAADWGAHEETRDVSSDRGVLRRIAKSFLEADRVEWIRESYAVSVFHFKRKSNHYEKHSYKYRYKYNVQLTKMRPLESSPKNDILIGLPSSFQSNRDWCQDKDAMQFPIYLNRLVKSLCKDEVSKSAIWDMAFIEYVVFELQPNPFLMLPREN